ncbi:hypothetical protein PDE_04008 [Penicillium oxalicum 114-2]|uniref:MFS-type transporter poxA n=2 Tax=Penicillium oxalicum TaxID=69781 RepID=POXA_PENO1|nr:RecName: Full=MFS-type transporter poxA; AltName: Full=Oxaleimides biosynthesis cluster protein A [Penicillium oxalicum]S7ZK48.1 RecName: Full=MFS-type transporter poxA; AltName: Full=Oxaleimides biosynthesis cluster protein A [Penicillium oxalicum 114-2]ARF05975.1 PoxA [Penicillium oxalicum]EPS29061.1 hypothetical protein PDE_04008 [Penicillium oxalicum 114-2]
MPASDRTSETGDVEKVTAAETPKEVPASNAAESTALTGLPLYTVLVGLGLALFLGAMDMAMLGTAVPSITSTFHTTADIGWYGAAYPLTMSSIQLLAGKIYAQFPQKLVFLVFFGLFMLGSLLCGVAVNSPMFIVGRATAGAGAAGVLSGTLAIVSAVVPLDKQSLILGLMMSLVGTAVVLGPVISGLLTDHSTWRWCFYLNLPCGGVTLLALILFFRPPKRPTRTTPLSIPELIKKLDLAGCLGFIPAVVMLLLALQWGGDGSKEHAWNSATIIGLFCGAGVSLILFLIWEHYQGDDAMLPLKFFRDLTIIASCLYGFALLGGYVVVGYFLPEWFQIIKGANPQSSAVMLLPNVITNFISKAVIGVIVNKTGYFNPWLFFGAAVLAIGSGLETNFHPSTPRPNWIGYQILQGAALGIIQAPTLGVQVALAKQKHLIPVALSLVIFFQYFGSSIMLSISLTIFQNLLRPGLVSKAGMTEAQVQQYVAAGNSEVRELTAQIDPSRLGVVLEVYNDAIAGVMWLSTAAALFGFLVSFGFPWKSLKAQTEENKKEAAEEEEEVKVAAVEA